MKRITIYISAIYAVLILSVHSLQAQNEVYQDFSAEVNLEYHQFFNEGLYPDQKQRYLSLAITPEYLIEWKGGEQSIKITAFGRIDQYDSKRTHFDIRELYWQRVKGSQELSIGIKKVFWGVTESVHLVDFINQTDNVESFDGEQKLGQPMVHYSYLTNFGIFDLFYMPYFRKRVFPGEKGRLRTPFIIEPDDIEFESQSEEFRPDFAFRWSHYIGKFDIGLSHFYGTGREPIITDLENFRAMYGVVNRSGLDLQATTGPLLWKFEGVYQYNDLQDFYAMAAGFEYTFGNIAGKGLDIGILGEYLYDGRDELALSSMQNDIFAGSRLAFNDVKSTELLMGTIIDLEHSSRLYSVEASRRIGSSWSGSVEARIFDNVSNEEFLYFLRQDSFLKFSVSKYF